MRFDPDWYKDKLRGKRRLPVQEANATIQQLPTVLRLASVERSTVYQEGGGLLQPAVNPRSCPCPCGICLVSPSIFCTGRAKHQALEANNPTKRSPHMDWDSTQSARTSAGLC